MKERFMIKKHLITCSVMMVQMIISSLSFGSLVSRKTPDKARFYSGFVSYKRTAPAALNFADEVVPVKDKKVRWKIRHSLWKHSFSNVQTDMLHQKAIRMFPVIEPILKAYGIPDDFKFMPLVESGFGEGKSTRGAYGPWQFMPGTARTYGLRVNKHHDDRVSIRKSTIAACKYLLELHQEFNSWTLTAAAYNVGSPMLERIMKKQSLKNYFKMHMNRETGSYVYNLVAMKEVINNPASYGYNVTQPVYAGIPKFSNDLLAFN
jgi:membrane-bound lytic murein transglycosylase D